MIEFLDLLSFAISSALMFVGLATMAAALWAVLGHWR